MNDSSVVVHFNEFWATDASEQIAHREPVRSSQRNPQNVTKLRGSGPGELARDDLRFRMADQSVDAGHDEERPDSLRGACNPEPRPFDGKMPIVRGWRRANRWRLRL